jgi:hypothetical protein
MRINPKAVLEEVNNLSEVFEALTTETGVLGSDDSCYDYFADSLDRLKTLVMNGLTPVEKRELILAQAKEQRKEGDPEGNSKVILFPPIRH